MKFLWEAFTGIAAAATTSLLVMGAIILAITEGMVLPAAGPVEEVATLDPMQSIQFAFTTPTPQRPKIPLVAAPTQPVATSCPMPDGWEAHIVQKGETLRALAESRQTTIEFLVKKNCLTGPSLIADTRLFLPPAPPPTQTPLIPTSTYTATATPTVCTPPAGWARYLVRPDDTLFKIATIFGTTWQNLQKANCMGYSTLIFPGKSIYVPNVAPRYTATSVPSYPRATARPSPTRTFTVRPTNTNTPTTVFTSTATIPTLTNTPTATFTNTPTITNTPTSTPTFTPTATNTHTFTPTGTNTPTITSTPTATSTYTDTPTGS